VSDVTPDEILNFWFDVPMGAEHGQVRSLWFTKSPEIDALVRARCGATVEAALRGELDGWAATPRGALALILLLDQFTRNIFRDTPRAFAGDPQALALATQLVDGGLDRRLSPLQRWFVYLPFEHAESLPLQERSVALFQQLADEGLVDPLDWAIRHRNVIARFGRFPHRNEILGRSSTAEEQAFLAQPGSRF
jgi:uncharacterized protein (DUF924 family)